MKIRKYIWALCCLAMIACDNDDTKTLCYGVHNKLAGDITAMGAVGDGNTDCSVIINQMIANLPAEGGVILIPEGDFVLDAPIIIDRDNVTIKGLNPGFRSNIDVKPESLLGPGGGSKLILRKAEVAIQTGNESISGLTIKNILVSGGTSNNGTGVKLLNPTENAKIDNIIGINLKQGLDISQATHMQISDCWICEVENSIKMQKGKENTVRSCQLGAQPKGITCFFEEEKKLSFEKNQVYPDGSSNLVLSQCDQAKIMNNNFKSYYVGILCVNGNQNIIENNLFWLADAVNDQLLDRGAEYGVVRILGDNNQFIQNTLTCEWTVGNGVTVRMDEGKGNVIQNCLLNHLDSNQAIWINQYTTIKNCVPEENIKRTQWN